jgi:UrcA family protein
MTTATRFRPGPAAFLAVPAMLAAAILAAPTARADAGDYASVTVSFADLDLNTPQGTAALYGRLETASQTVCRSFEGRGLALRSAHRRCVAGALSAAVGRVGRTQLTAYHEARVGAATSRPRIASATP